MSDDDTESISTTAIMGAADIDDYVICDDEYRISRLSVNAKPFYPMHRYVRVQPNFYPLWSCARDFQMAEYWKAFVRINDDKFYSWIENLPPELLFSTKSLNLMYSSYKLPDGSTVDKSRARGVFYSLFGKRLRGKRFHCPLSLMLIVYKGKQDQFDVWYSLSSEDRKSISEFFEKLDIDWFDKHVP